MLHAFNSNEFHKRIELYFHLNKYHVTLFKSVVSQGRKYTLFFKLIILIHHANFHFDIILIPYF